MRQIYQPMRLWISFFLILCIVWGATTAQSSRDVVINQATYDDDNNLVIQVALADDVTIQSAELRFDGAVRVVSVERDLATIERWYVLDASSNMRDVSRLVVDELRDSVSIASDRLLVGGIIYPSDGSILMPTNAPDDFADWISTYQLDSGEDCILLALDDIPNVTQLARTHQQIIVFTSNVSDSCNDTQVSLSAQSDFLVFGNGDLSDYIELADANGGAVIQATLSRFSQDFQALLEQLNSPIYVLSTPLSEPIDNAELSLTLSDDSTIVQTISPTGEFSFAPTVVPATDTETPTDIPATEEESSTNATETAILDEPTETVEVTDDSAVVASTSESTNSLTDVPEVIPDSPIVRSNSLLIIGGGVAAIVVVLVVMALLLGIGRSRSSTPDDSAMRYDTTLFSYNDEAEFDETDVVTIREMAEQYGPTHVANLINDKDEIIYEIHRPVATLGRRIGSDILIAGDNQISREHARFTTRDDGTVWITRMTTNPILINGTPMEKMRQLQEGDTVQISPTLLLRFQLLPPEEQPS